MGVQLDETEKRIVDLIEANRDEIIAFARDMYTHAELGYKEFKTAEKFTRLMKKLNLPVKEHLANPPDRTARNEYRRIVNRPVNRLFLIVINRLINKVKIIIRTVPHGNIVSRCRL